MRESTLDRKGIMSRYRNLGRAATLTGKLYNYSTFEEWYLEQISLYSDEKYSDCTFQIFKGTKKDVLSEEDIVLLPRAFQGLCTIEINASKRPNWYKLHSELLPGVTFSDTRGMFNMTTSAKITKTPLTGLKYFSSSSQKKIYKEYKCQKMFAINKKCQEELPEELFFKANRLLLSELMHRFRATDKTLHIVDDNITSRIYGLEIHTFRDIKLKNEECTFTGALDNVVTYLDWYNSEERDGMNIFIWDIDQTVISEKDIILIPSKISKLINVKDIASDCVYSNVSKYYKDRFRCSVAYDHILYRATGFITQQEAFLHSIEIRKEILKKESICFEDPDKFLEFTYKIIDKFRDDTIGRLGSI